MNVRVVAVIPAVIIIAALGTASCTRDTTPPPGSPALVDQNATVTGQVWLHDTDGIKPYVDVDVSAWVQVGKDRTGAPLSGWRTPNVKSGPDGRYSFTVPTGAYFRVNVQTSAAYQPCVTQIASVNNNASLDVHVFADPANLGAHLPGELAADSPTLSGTVFETTALGRQPVPGVRVELDMFAGLGDVSARTLTDADGRYVLCGLRGFASTYVWASKSGYKTAEVGTVQLNGNTIRDIELQR